MALLKSGIVNNIKDDSYNNKNPVLVDAHIIIQLLDYFKSWSMSWRFFPTETIRVTVGAA